MLLFSRQSGWIGTLLRNFVHPAGRRSRRRQLAGVTRVVSHRSKVAFAEFLEERTLLTVPPGFVPGPAGNEVITVSTDSGGNLLLCDISSTGLADNLTLTVVSTDLQIVDPDNVLVTLVGTQVSDHEVRVPLAQITTLRVIAELNQGDDQLDAVGLGANLHLVASGGSGKDTLTGGSLGDTILGGSGSDSLNGGSGADIIQAGSGSDVVSGDAGNDLIFGGAGNDSLSGDTGNDTSFGGQGRDTIDGGSGSDVLRGFAGRDMINGGDDDDHVHGGAGRDNLEGGDGADSVVGGIGQDTLLGGADDDTLEGSAGNDSISGNAGSDRAIFSSDTSFTISDALVIGAGSDNIDMLEVVQVTAGDSPNNIDATAVTQFALVISAGGGNDTVFGGALNDTLSGDDGADFVNGRNGGDVVSGNDGNDTLQGGTGVDFVDGGDGDDNVQGSGSSGDTIRGGLGNDTLDGGAGTGDIISEEGDVSFTLTTTQLTGLGTDTVLNIEGAMLVGGASDNAIDVSASAMPTTLTGNGGNDTLTGGAATDLLIETGDVDLVLTDSGLTGLGTDVYSAIDQIQLRGGSGNNRIDASLSTRAVTLSGGDGDDTLIGGLLADILFGEDGNDHLTGNGGADNLLGGDGTDRLVESGDNDFTLGSGSLDGAVKDIINSFEEAKLTGGASANTFLITTFAGPVTLDGGGGNDSLEGTSFDDSLEGGDGDDTLKGEEGNDTLSGDAGADNLLGGSGSDSISGGDGNDRLRGELGTDTLLTGDDTLNGGAGNDDIDGEAGNDVISAGPDDDSALGGVGNDTVNGGAGADDLRGDDGSDTVSGGSENDTLQGGLGNDLLDGGDGDDAVLGDAGSDTLSGGGDDDFVDGDIGNDSIHGDGGNDELRGSDGDDTVFGDAGQDSLLGMLGNDSLDGGDGSDIVLGDLGNDVVLGGADRDVVIGDHGSDQVNGGDGDDLVTGSSYRFDNDLASLAQLLTDWNAGTSYTTRVAQLEDADYAYQWEALALITDGGTLYDDYALDTVNGGAGQDYFGRPGEPTLATTDLTPDRDANLETLNVSVFGNEDPGSFPADMTEPGYLQTLNDPTYGTPTTRITGDPGEQMTLPINTGGTATVTWSGAVRTRYVTDSSWNIDSSLIILRSYDPAMPYQIVLDGSTHQPLYLASLPSSNFRWSQNPAKSNIQYGFPQLSTLDNDALGIDGSMAVLPTAGPDDDVFVEYNIATGQVLRTVELPFNKLFSPKTTISFRNGNEFIAMFGIDKANPSSGISVYIVQLDATEGADPIIASFPLTDGTSGTPEPENANALDFSNLWFSPDGNHLLTLYGGSTVTTRSWRLLDVNYNSGAITSHVIPELTGDAAFQTNGDRTKGHFPVNWSHPVFTTAPDGDTYVFGVSGQFNGQPFDQSEITTSNGSVGSVLAFNVTDNTFHSLTDPTNENLATHVIATNTLNPEYVFVTYWNDTTNPARGTKYSGEIIAIKLTDPFGTNGIIQLVHHRTSIANVNYYGNTLPTVSPDGTKLIFSSTWGEVQASVSTYLLDLTSRLP